MPSILQDPAFYATLLMIDLASAAAARAAGCPFCGGRLHFARYRRKPRSPLALGPAFCLRQSLCCAAEGCRRRTTPRSVLFLGRRVHVGAVVVLASALVHGVTPRRARTLREAFEVDRRTLARWRRWWRTSLPATRFWRAARARLMPPVEETALPQSLVARFAAHARAGLVALLRFLSGLFEGSSRPAEDARGRAAAVP
jgi:hypothetical protein